MTPTRPLTQKEIEFLSYFELASNMGCGILYSERKELYMLYNDVFADTLAVTNCPDCYRKLVTKLLDSTNQDISQ